MKIYVVIGSTGEYSDRSEWSVIAYRTEAKAKQHVELATKRANEIHVMERDNEFWNDVTHKNMFDPYFQYQYTGTRYYYTQVELATKLPKG